MTASPATLKQTQLSAQTDANGNCTLEFAPVAGSASIQGVSLSAPNSSLGGNAIVYVNNAIQGISFWAKQDTATSVTPTVVPAGGTLTIVASNLSPNVSFSAVISYEYTVA